MPLGILRLMAHLASMGGVPPETVVALATGNTARVHGLDTGVIAPGRAADLCIVDAPVGSVGTTALEALANGDIPGVSMVLVDGVPLDRAESQHGAGGADGRGRHGTRCRRGRALMRFGLRLPSFALGEDTASLADMGAYLRRAEDLGFESAVLIDHLLVAPPAYRTTWLEPISLLSALAGVTRTMRLGTLVLVLPFRDPGRVRQGMGDARRAVRRPLDPRRRRRLARRRVRRAAHPVP